MLKHFSISRIAKSTGTLLWDQGETPLDFTVAKVKVGPHWYTPIRWFRFRLWRRRIERDYNRLPPHVRAALDVMQRRIDDLMFYGPDGRL